MPVDPLENWATSIWQNLPLDENASEFCFTRERLPEPPALLETTSLVIKAGHHDYGNYRVDYPQWHASKELCGRLGILILAAVFHEISSDIVVRLVHQDSDIKELWLRLDQPASLP